MKKLLWLPLLLTPLAVAAHVTPCGTTYAPQTGRATGEAAGALSGSTLRLQNQTFVESASV